MKFRWVLVVVIILLGLSYTAYGIYDCDILSSPDNTAVIEICYNFVEYKQVGENATCTFWEFEDDPGVWEVCNE